MDRYTPSSVNSDNLSSDERRLSLRQRFLKAGAIASLGVATLSACGPNAEAQPEPAPTTTQGVETPTPVESPVEVEPAPVETEAPVEVGGEIEPIPAGLSAEELARASNDLWQKWLHAGATEETVQQTSDEADEFVGDYADFLTYKARQNAEQYATVYFTEGWESDPALVSLYEYAVEANAEKLRVALHRFTTNEPHVTLTETITNVIDIEAPEGQQIIRYDIDGIYENSESTQYSPRTTSQTFDVSDGTARLTAYSNILHD